ncbi:recombinase family protein [Priestia aryabhattai]|uniref:recombinase family protein n=1 Tax=Priestia aryabhattai TaxID=412384 RepID=UPI003D29F875
MRYGYARVSTRGQVKGNSLQDQRNQLQQYGCDEIIEEAYSAKQNSRPLFNELIDKLQEGDTLIVAKLDRLARNVKEGIELVEHLFEKNVQVHVLNVGLLENTTMGRFFLQTMLAVAEMERNLIIERTQEGKAIAKERPDFREGRPKKFKRKQVNHALDLLKKHTYKEVSEMTGISKRTLIRRKKEQEEKELLDM